VARRLTDDDLLKASSLFDQYPNLTTSLGQDWIRGQIETIKRGGRPHPVLLYFDSPYGEMVADKLEKWFSILMEAEPVDLQKLVKKLQEASNQPGLETACQEIEVAALFFGAGHPIRVEPAGLHREGPDLETEILGYRVYVEEKKRYPSEDVQVLWTCTDEISKRLRRLKLPFEVYYTLDDSFEEVNIQPFANMIKQELQRLTKQPDARFPVRLSYPDEGHPHARAKIYHNRSLVGTVVSGGWVSIGDPQRLVKRIRKKALSSRQFPKEGLHIVLLDTGKLASGEEIAQEAWRRKLRGQLELRRGKDVNALILCPRVEGGHVCWLNDLTSGAVILQNPRAPLPECVLQELQRLFMQPRGKS